MVGVHTTAPVTMAGLFVHVTKATNWLMTAKHAKVGQRNNGCWLTSAHPWSAPYFFASSMSASVSSKLPKSTMFDPHKVAGPSRWLYVPAAHHQWFYPTSSKPPCIGVPLYSGLHFFRAPEGVNMCTLWNVDIRPHHFFEFRISTLYHFKFWNRHRHLATSMKFGHRSHGNLKIGHWQVWNKNCRSMDPSWPHSWTKKVSMVVSEGPLDTLIYSNMTSWPQLDRKAKWNKYHFGMGCEK